MEFTDEEGYGRYLDLHDCYLKYINLKSSEVRFPYCFPDLGVQLMLSCFADCVLRFMLNRVTSKGSPTEVAQNVLGLEMREGEE